MHRNRYGKLAAQVYQAAFPVDAHSEDVAYYLSSLASIVGSVLEPAVGNGRMLVKLLVAGLNAEGFDASPEMLEKCRENCQSNGFEPSLTEASFEAFRFKKKYAAVVMPAGSFQLITDYDVACGFLSRVHQGLAPGGKLIFDLGLVGGQWSDCRLQKEWQYANGESVTVTEEATDSNEDVGLRFKHTRYDRWRDQKIVQSEVDLIVLRWWPIKEMISVLQKIGFSDIIMCGDYVQDQQPNEGHQIVTFEAIR